jgi:hypothetical protein
MSGKNHAKSGKYSIIPRMIRIKRATARIVSALMPRQLGRPDGIGIGTMLGLDTLTRAVMALLADGPGVVLAVEQIRPKPSRDQVINHRRELRPSPCDQSHATHLTSPDIPLQDHKPEQLPFPQLIAWVTTVWIVLKLLTHRH